MSRDFLPTASLAVLQRRAALLARVRRFFDERGFLEVETPLLSHDSVVDRHIDPLPVTFFRDPQQPHAGKTLWLQTSPEFAMKRLLAAGAQAIYQVCKAFRGGQERGALHNPEFTLVEWYRVGDGYEAGMQLLSDLAEMALAMGPAQRITFREAFRTWAGVDPLLATDTQLRQVAQEFTHSDPRDRNAAIDALLVFVVEPHLGQKAPTILYDYPADQAALAVVRADDPPVAERFELYVRGRELANGYHELLDPEILRRRNRENNALRASEGRYALPEESRLLNAMQAGLPACSGCALGFDRLLMAAAGASSIDEVLAFPIERA
jgi:lysyl-tRNA synthetase class 2